MTELGKELEMALSSRCDHTLEDLTQTDIDAAAKEVFLKWMEKAFRAGENYEYGNQFGPVPNNRPNYERWLKENGITE